MKKLELDASRIAEIRQGLGKQDMKIYAASCSISLTKLKSIIKPTPFKKLTESRKEEIRNNYKGDNKSDYARECNISLITLNKVLLEMGYAVERQIVDTYCAAVGKKKHAASFNITPHTLDVILKKYDLKIKTEQHIALDNDNKWYLWDNNKNKIYLGFYGGSSLVRYIHDNKEIYVLEALDKTTETREHEIKYIMEDDILTIDYYNFEKKLTLVPSKKSATCNMHDAERHDRITINMNTFRVLKVSLESYGNRDVLYELKPFFKEMKYQELQPYTSMLVSYDMETCEFKTEDILYNQNQNPYMCCMIIELCYYNERYLVEEVKLEHHDLSRESSIPEQVYDVLFNITNGLAKGLSIVLFGYNNHRFDDNFLYKEWMRKKVFFKNNMRNNRMTKSDLFINGCRIKIFDMIKYTPDMNLSQACADYEIKEAKLAFDIVAYNNMSEKRNTKDMLRICSKQEFTSLCKNQGPMQMRSLFSQLKEITLKEREHAKNTSERCFPLVDLDDTGNIRNVFIYNYVLLYCLYDCKAVLELYHKINNVMTDIFKDLLAHDVHMQDYTFSNYVSPSQIAGVFMKKLLHNQEIQKMEVQNTQFGKFIYESYFGGRVDFSFIGEYVANSTISMMDVTSQYTCAMTSNFPCVREPSDIELGHNIDLERYQKIIDKVILARDLAKSNRTLDNYVYFEPFEKIRAIFLCDIIAPEDKSNLCTFAPVPKHTTTNLAYLNTTQYDRVLNSVHFKNLILVGFKIKLKPHKFNIVFLRVEPIFRTFVNILGDIKVNARNDDNKTKAKLVKLLLNSAAGKLAQKPEDIIDEFKHTSQYIDNVRYKKSNWSNSYHYLATFITAEANTIIFFKLVELELDYIYRGLGLEYRCGAVLYMDTDSVAFDRALCNNKIEFKETEEIGVYNPEKCFFDVTWKEKLKNESILCVLAKKSYIVFDKNKKEKLVKLKGVHTASMGQISKYEDVKCILDGRARKLEIRGLARSDQGLESGLRLTNRSRGIGPAKSIYQATIKKTVARAKDYNIIKPKNSYRLKCLHNLNKTIFKGQVHNYLEFCCSKYALD